MSFEYTVSLYDEDTDIETEVDLTCEVEFELADRSVGIMNSSADLVSAVDEDGTEFFDKLHANDIEAIEIYALDLRNSHMAQCGRVASLPFTMRNPEL